MLNMNEVVEAASKKFVAQKDIENAAREELRILSDHLADVEEAHLNDTYNKEAIKGMFKSTFPRHAVETKKSMVRHLALRFIQSDPMFVAAKANVDASTCEYSVDSAIERVLGFDDIMKSFLIGMQDVASVGHWDVTSMLNVVQEQTEVQGLAAALNLWNNKDNSFAECKGCVAVDMMRPLEGGSPGSTAYGTAVAAGRWKFQAEVRSILSPLN